jgi:hypothetical protein
MSQLELMLKEQQRLENEELLTKKRQELADLIEEETSHFGLLKSLESDLMETCQSDKDYAEIRKRDAQDKKKHKQRLDELRQEIVKLEQLAKEQGIDDLTQLALAKVNQQKQKEHQPNAHPDTRKEQIARIVQKVANPLDAQYYKAKERARGMITKRLRSHTFKTYVRRKHDMGVNGRSSRFMRAYITGRDEEAFDPVKNLDVEAYAVKELLADWATKDCQLFMEFMKNKYHINVNVQMSNTNDTSTVKLARRSASENLQHRYRVVMPPLMKHSKEHGWRIMAQKKFKHNEQGHFHNLPAMVQDAVSTLAKYMHQVGGKYYDDEEFYGEDLDDTDNDEPPRKTSIKRTNK